MPLASPPQQTTNRMRIAHRPAAFAASIIVIAISTWAQARPAASGFNGRLHMTEEHFTGRDIDLRVAIQRASTIVIASVHDVGNVDVGAPGQSYYHNAKVEVVRWLRNGANEKILNTSLTIAYTVQKLPKEAAERVLLQGKLYVFFLSSRPDDSPIAFKITPAETKYVDEVEKVLKH
jgi:hypothetical protein